jgi:hypothetical protein
MTMIDLMNEPGLEDEEPAAEMDRNDRLRAAVKILKTVVEGIRPYLLDDPDLAACSVVMENTWTALDSEIS